MVRPYTVVRVRRTQVRLPRPLQGPDHVQLTLLNWDIESVLTLNKKNWLVTWKFQFFYLVSKQFWCPN